MAERDLSKKHAARARVAGTGGGEAAAPDPVVETERDLDNEQTQQEIIEPKSRELTVGGQPTKLYPLPGRASRDFVVLFTDVMGAFTESQLKVHPAMRMGRVIHKDFGDEVARFAARSEYEPGAELPGPEVLEARAQEIGDNADFLELAALFDQMGELNRIKEIFGVPKSIAGSTKQTS